MSSSATIQSKDQNGKKRTADSSTACTTTETKKPRRSLQHPRHDEDCHDASSTELDSLPRVITVVRRPLQIPATYYVVWLFLVLCMFLPDHAVSDIHRMVGDITMAAPTLSQLIRLDQAALAKSICHDIPSHIWEQLQRHARLLRAGPPGSIRQAWRMFPQPGRTLPEGFPTTMRFGHEEAASQFMLMTRAIFAYKKEYHRRRLANINHQQQQRRAVTMTESTANTQAPSILFTGQAIQNKTLIGSKRTRAKMFVSTGMKQAKAASIKQAIEKLEKKVAADAAGPPIRNIHNPPSSI